MTDEEFQSVVLQQLKALTEGQQETNKRLDTLETGQQETHQELQEVNKRLDSLEQGQNRVESKVDKLEISMENEVIEKVRGLFDAREVQSDINQQILNTLQRMEAKIDVLQLETAHIRRVK